MSSSDTQIIEAESQDGSPFPDFGEACVRMVASVRTLHSINQSNIAHLLMSDFLFAARDGDEPKMRTELGKAEALVAVGGFR
jgi:hypothetical protein